MGFNSGFKGLNYNKRLLLMLLLLPLALQPAVGFGLSNNTSPFFPIYHQLSPPSTLPALEDLVLLLLSILSWVFLFVSSFPVLE